MLACLLAPFFFPPFVIFVTVWFFVRQLCCCCPGIKSDPCSGPCCKFFKDFWDRCFSAKTKTKVHLDPDTLGEIREVVNRVCLVQLSRIQAAGVNVQHTAPVSGQNLPPVSSQGQTTPPASTSANFATNFANVKMQVISEKKKKNNLGNQAPKKAKLGPLPAQNVGGDDTNDGDNDSGSMDDQGVIRD